MKTIYFNLRTPEGIETVDHFNREEEQMEVREFKKYVNKMLAETRSAGMNVYISSRPTKEYGKR